MKTYQVRITGEIEAETPLDAEMKFFDYNLQSGKYDLSVEEK
jgi:hypothetical protein